MKDETRYVHVYTHTHAHTHACVLMHAPVMDLLRPAFDLLSLQLVV